ncbi:MAG: ABC transporter substrate-binding protein [Anaerolineales bacterium]
MTDLLQPRPQRAAPKRLWLWILLAILIVACLTIACAAGGAAWLISSGRITLGGRTPAVATPGASRGTALDLRLMADPPTTLDPAMVEDSTSAEYVDKIYSGLVGLDEDLNVVPEIAERWDISDDGTVYTFHLRDNVYFHNGRKATAQDFKYSVERACDPATRSPVARAYLGDIVGAEEKLDGRASQVRGVEVLDDRTVRITIRAARASFLAKLTYPTGFVVAKEVVESGSSWWRKPVGTGPFRLRSWDAKQIVLEKHDRYYQPLGDVRTVTFLFGGGAPVTMYEQGELDAAPVGVADIERVLDPANPLHYEVQETPLLYTQYVGFNVRQPPFDDPMVRRAFALATNKQAMADVFFKRTRVPATGILPPGMPGYNENLRAIPFDPDKAREALKASRYGGAENLPRIVLTVTGEGATNAFANLLAGMYEEVLGVHLEIEQVDWATYLQDLNAHRLQMFTLAWSTDYPDPENFLETQFHSRSELNNTGYSDAEVDRLLEEAMTERDTATRLALYQQAEQRIVDDAPWIPLFHGVDYTLVKPYLRGLKVTAQGNYHLRAVFAATQ